MDQLTAQRLVLQHAESSRLLGVSFVPVYRRCDADEPDQDGAEEADADLSPRPDIQASEPQIPAPAATTQLKRPSLNLDGALLPIDTAPGVLGFEIKGLEIKPVSRRPGDVQAALDKLRERYELDAPHKQFVTAHTHIVFGEGDPCAALMFIGEAPGAEEDKTGRPFVGRAGQLLNKMITAMGLKREQVYIANVLKTRPPDNATPTSDEIRICAPYLYTQIAIIQPRAIVTLGLPATRALLNTTDSMSRLRGRWATFTTPGPDRAAVPVMPTYHPAFLLRSYTAENRAKVWSDLQQVMDRLGLRGPAAAGGVPGE